MTEQSKPNTDPEAKVTIEALERVMAVLEGQMTKLEDRLTEAEENTRRSIEQLRKMETIAELYDGERNNSLYLGPLQIEEEHQQLLEAFEGLVKLHREVADELLETYPVDTYVGRVVRSALTQERVSNPTPPKTWSLTTSAATESTSYRELFQELAQQWKHETRFMSNVKEMACHPAYQRIIGLGEAAIPLILRDMVENGPNHWFWALQAITGENPVTDDIAGHVQAMTEAWLHWGKTNGYLIFDKPPEREGQN